MSPIACSSSLFHQLSLEQALQGIAELGFRRVDLMAVEGWYHLDPSAIAYDVDAAEARLRRALEAAGLELDSVNIWFATGLHDRRPDACERRQAEAAAMAELMVRFGVATASLVPSRPDHKLTAETQFQHVVASLGEIVAATAPRGRTMALECHLDSIMRDPAVLASILDQVPGLMVAYDPSHLIVQGIALEDTGPLLARAGRVHVRDAARDQMQARYGRGELDLDQLLRLLAEHGYAGGYTIGVVDPRGSRAAREDAQALTRALTERGVA